MRLTVAKNVGLMIGGPIAALSLDRFEVRTRKCKMRRTFEMQMNMRI